MQAATGHRDDHTVCPASADDAKRWIKTLADAKESGEEAYWTNALAEVCYGPGTERLTRFAKFCAEASQSSVDVDVVNCDEMLELGRQLLANLLSVRIQALKSCNYHSNVLQDFALEVAEAPKGDEDAESKGPATPVQQLRDDVYWSDPIQLT